MPAEGDGESGLRPRTRRARRLRREATEVEQRLWRALRGLGLPMRIRRQHPVGDHIVDFAIPAAKLAIELDGGQHAAQAHEDERRTQEISARDYRVIRFWNNEVNENLDGVLERILDEIGVTPTSPRPSPPPEGAERE